MVRRAGWQSRLEPAAGYVTAAAGVALVTAAIGALLARFRVANISMLYLVVVLVVAVRYGRREAIFASVAAFLAFNWFFIAPVHTLTIADPEEWLALLLFLVVAVVTGHLAAGQRRRAEEALRREREALALRELSRILTASDNLDATLQSVCAHLATELSLVDCAVLLPDALPSLAGAPADRRVRLVPLPAGDHTVGTLRLVAGPNRTGWTGAEERLVNAAAEQLGRTVERARLRQAATEAERLRTTEEVRQAVLASVSHDLRTPLASIKASAESLAQRAINWTDEQRLGFAAAIVQESSRLSRLVDNLLDMSRIEAGRLQPDVGWYPLDALVDDVLGRLEGVTAGHVVRADVPEDLPPVPLDYVQIGEVLANLVENAVKYTPPGSEIAVSASGEDGWVRVAVRDNGPGLPASALPHIFEKFYRVSGGDRTAIKGTGLGLAVARGYVEAHGGTIEAASPPPGAEQGTEIAFRLPLRPPDGAPPLAPVAAEQPEVATTT